MRHYDEDGVCEVCGGELTRMPQVYRAPYYFCSVCEEVGGAGKGRRPPAVRRGC